MNMRRFIQGALALAALALAGFGAWVFSLPPAAPARAMPAITPDETAAMLAALKPPKRARPLVAVVGLNDATETTDYLVPTGILRRADVADVRLLATGPGPVKLYPALTVQPDATLAQFDARHPEGADYVVVPAMRRDDDPAVLAWLRAQAGKGAIVIAVCAGAKVAGAAGLLDGRQATTHWYFLKELRGRHPSIRYVADRRMVVDRGVATTTGISASMPMMLRLIEAIAGAQKAQAVGRELGLPAWDARHDSSAFRLTRPFAATVLGNVLAFWRRDQVGLALRPGMDEASLALVADAWSRTYRSRAVTFAASTDAVVTRHGIRVIPDRSAVDQPTQARLDAVTDDKPVGALNQTLKTIGADYGMPTASVVAMQLEYPW